ncbi:peptidase S14 [Rhizobium laguerreae]|uniref:peptidase S14 n=1 Tax=Rhizobium laguerreae TaxID=1076926 RepID=UPI001C920E1D|nr:peptidase S14 [Rhizobium laguerreae]MBY3259569.1 peptidase S14 [Rhizobium laguerreae]MBY3287005.1 peptidase S14 [Rhizobium laguerreae]MBY3293976.1 peptidase S14 [Rhizobium laguerreae]
MTVIVYDSKRELMIADSRATSGGTHPIGAKMKIHEITAGKCNGALLGVTTEIPGMGEAFKEWVTEGMSKEAFDPSFSRLEALLAKRDNSVYLFAGSYFPSGPLVSDFFTIGSGAEYALGAYKACGDPYRAVEVAIECDLYCGPPIVSRQLRTPDANQPPTIRHVIRLLRNFGGGTAT